MKQATTIGLDIAKHVFHVHGADGAGHVLFRKRITRVKLLSFLAAQTRCVVAMEASKTLPWGERSSAACSSQPSPRCSLYQHSSAYCMADAKRPLRRKG